MREQPNKKKDKKKKLLACFHRCCVAGPIRRAAGGVAVAGRVRGRRVGGGPSSTRGPGVVGMCGITLGISSCFSSGSVRFDEVELYWAASRGRGFPLLQSVDRRKAPISTKYIFTAA